jgi:hypothetical protein
MPIFKSDDAVIYFDYEKDDGLINIQIVEGRLDLNALIVLDGKELEKFLNYCRENLK